MSNSINIDSEAIIHSHNFSKKNPYTYFGDGPYFGLEVEVDCENAPEDFHQKLCLIFIKYQNKHFTVEHDKSLTNGVEIVLQPHSLIELKKYLNTEFKNMLTELAQTGCEEGAPKAGIHIHVSRELFGTNIKEQLENIAKIGILFSNHKEKIIQIGHRTNINYSYFPVFNRLDEYNSILKILNRDGTKKHHCAHYKAINIINDATIEFRCFQSSLRINQIIFGLDFIYHISKKAVIISKAEADNGDTGFSDFPYNIEDFC